MTKRAPRGSASTNLVVTLLVVAIVVVAWLAYSRSHMPPSLPELLAAAEVPAAQVAYEVNPSLGISDAGFWEGTDLHRAGATEAYTFRTRRMNRGGAVRPRVGVPIRVRLRILAESDDWSGIAPAAGFIDSTSAPRAEGGVLTDSRRAWAVGLTDADGRLQVDVKLEIPPRDGPDPYLLELVADEFELSSDGRTLELVASTVHSVDVSLP